MNSWNEIFNFAPSCPFRPPLSPNSLIILLYRIVLIKDGTKPKSLHMAQKSSCLNNRFSYFAADRYTGGDFIFASRFVCDNGVGLPLKAFVGVGASNSRIRAALNA